MINDYLCYQCWHPKMEGGTFLCSFCNAYTGSIPVQSKHYGTQHSKEDVTRSKVPVEPTPEDKANHMAEFWKNRDTPATTAPGEGVAPATAEEQEVSEQFDSMVEAASVPDLATLMRRAIKSGAVQPTVAYHQQS